MRQHPAVVKVGSRPKPENVCHAVEWVNPYGVDVSSGVETAPGRKDPDKVSEFIRRAKGR